MSDTPYDDSKLQQGIPGFLQGPPIGAKEAANKEMARKAKQQQEQLARDMPAIQASFPHLANLQVNNEVPQMQIDDANTPRQRPVSPKIGPRQPPPVQAKGVQPPTPAPVAPQQQEPYFEPVFQQPLAPPPVMPAPGINTAGLNAMPGPRYQTGPGGMPSRPAHPVLNQLREKFGLTPEQKYHDYTVEGITFKLEMLNGEKTAMASRVAEENSFSMTEFTVRLRRAVASACVARVEQDQIEDVLDIPLTKPGGREFTPMERREEAAKKFYAMMMNEEGKWYELGDKIYLEYIQHLDSKSTILESINPIDKDKILYQCPVDGCQETFKGEENEKRFCPTHGVQLVKVADLATELNIPLE